MAAEAAGDERVKRQDRTQAVRLESVLAAHTERMAAINKRALADLHTVGLTQLKTIEDAYERLEAQRELAGFSQQQIDVVLYARRKAKRAA